ncbi:hypothetical protein [Mesorhizobium carmichaelinearum]|uniref:hypothetical protein n=1 Tax=Mesorhizobium carmichaelinearum TaxID=1208188 RepID=UPI000BA3A508|nr:hypothetical protein [Mesorhizobium carmichaelinearum]
MASRSYGAGAYDIGELTSLLRKDQKPYLKGLLGRVVDGYRFLLTEAEKVLAADVARKSQRN